MVFQRNVGENVETWRRWVEWIDNTKYNSDKIGSDDNKDIVFRASSLAIPCMRKYNLDINSPEEFEDVELSNMMVGTLIHSKIQELYPECSKERLLELRTGDFSISGHLDMLDEEKGILYEIKSIAFLSAVKNGPKTYHLRQAMLYAGILNKNNVDVKEVVIVYVQKTNFEMVEFRFKYDHKIFEEVIEDAEELARSIKNGVIASSRKGDWCNFCKQVNKCKEIEKHGVVVQNVDV